jgi:hypothetical protein
VLVAAALCPHPPLLVPGVASGSWDEVEDLRTASVDAVRALVTAGPDLVVVVGAAPRVGPFDPLVRGSLRPYGVDVLVGSGAGEASLPLSLTVGLWLLEHAGLGLPRLLFGVAPDTATARCADLGATLADRSARVAMLVMGDGSARRSVKGPGYLDARAAGFDAGVEQALAAVDPEALLTLDSTLADDLLVAGRAAWQVLAGAALGRSGGHGGPAAPPFAGDVRHAAAPYGVGYLVATWLPSQP